MEKVFVKLERNGRRACFIVETDRSATALDHEGIRPFVRDDVQVICLREKGAKKYGWDIDAKK